LINKLYYLLVSIILYVMDNTYWVFDEWYVVRDELDCSM